MARRSTIDRLAPAHRDLVSQMREGGRTADDIRAELAQRGVKVSRSAVSRRLKLVDLASPLAMARELSSMRKEVRGARREIAAVRLALSTERARADVHFMAKSLTTRRKRGVK